MEEEQRKAIKDMFDRVDMSSLLTKVFEKLNPVVNGLYNIKVSENDN